MIDNVAMFTASTGETVVEKLTTSLAVDGLLSVGTQILNFITNNTLLLLCFSGCLVAVGCKVIRKIKRTAIK